MARIRTPKKPARWFSCTPTERIIKLSLIDAMDALARGPKGNSNLYNDLAQKNGYANAYEEALQFFSEGTGRQWFEIIWPDVDYDWMLKKLLEKYGPEAHGIEGVETSDDIELAIRFGNLNIAIVRGADFGAGPRCAD